MQQSEIIKERVHQLITNIFDLENERLKHALIKFSETEK